MCGYKFIFIHSFIHFRVCRCTLIHCHYLKEQSGITSQTTGNVSRTILLLVTLNWFSLYRPTSQITNVDGLDSLHNTTSPVPKTLNLGEEKNTKKQLNHRQSDTPGRTAERGILLPWTDGPEILVAYTDNESTNVVKRRDLASKSW